MTNYKLLFVLLSVLGLFLYLMGHGEAFASCNTIATFADGLSPIREIHVATDGSDTNGDGSVESPYATIGHGISQATPGTAVTIHSGTYAGGIYKNNVDGEDLAAFAVDFSADCLDDFAIEFGNYRCLNENIFNHADCPLHHCAVFGLAHDSIRPVLRAPAATYGQRHSCGKKHPPRQCPGGGLWAHDQRQRKDLQ